MSVFQTIAAAVASSSAAGTLDVSRQSVYATTAAARAAQATAPGMPPVARVYASELLDTATCKACAAIDGKTYASVDDAHGEYNTHGGYMGCLGGLRCRGTLVIVYATETLPGGTGDLPPYTPTTITPQPNPPPWSPPTLQTPWSAPKPTVPKPAPPTAPPPTAVTPKAGQALDDAVERAHDAIVRQHGQQAGGVRGDVDTAAVLDAAGYSGQPAVLGADEFAAFRGLTMTEGVDRVPTDVFYRGFARCLRPDHSELIPATDMVDQFVAGEYWVGQGVFGSGTYITGNPAVAARFTGTTRMVATETGWVDETISAIPFSSEEAAVLRIKIHPTARVAEWDDVPEDVQDSVQAMSSTRRGDAISRWAAENGYDAVNTSHNADPLSGILIFNRSKVVIEHVPR